MTYRTTSKVGPRLGAAHLPAPQDTHAVFTPPRPAPNPPRPSRDCYVGRSNCSTRPQAAVAAAQTGLAQPALKRGAARRPPPAVVPGGLWDRITHCDTPQDTLNKELFAAAARGDAEGIEAACRAGAQVDCVNRRGQTALHVAVRRFHTIAAIKLADLTQDIDRQDKRGSTALHYAAELGMNHLAFHLLHCGANPAGADGSGGTPLTRALEGAGFLAPNLELARYLLGNEAVDVTAGDNRALRAVVCGRRWSSEANKLEMIARLVLRGADACGLATQIERGSARVRVKLGLTMNRWPPLLRAISAAASVQAIGSSPRDHEQLARAIVATLRRP